MDRKVKAELIAEDKASSNIKKVGDSFTGLKNTVASADSPLANIRNQFESIARVGTIVTGVLTAGVGIGMTLLTKNALTQADALQQNRIAFETMLGSADKAKKLLVDLSKFAQDTPFELTDLQNYSKQLLAMGIDQEKIIDTMESLGNIAAGVGQDKLPQLVYAFGQVKVAGKLMGQDLMQFTNAGVPLLEMLAKNFNKTTSEIKDMVSEGKIGFADVEAALGSLSAEGGRFDGLMKKQMNTFSGVMSNLTDLRDKFFRLAGGITETGDVIEGGLLDTVSRAAKSLLQFFSENEAAIGEFIGKITGAVSTVIDFAAGIGTFLVTGEGMNDWFSNIIQRYPQLEGVITGITNVLQGLGDWISANQDLVKTFVVTLLGLLGAAAIVGIISGIVAAFNPLTLIIVGIAGLVALFKKAWDDNLGGIQEKVKNFISGFSEFLENLKQKFDEIVNSPAVQEFLRIMGEIITNIIANLQSSFEQIRPHIENLIAKFGEWMVTLQPVFEVIGAIAGIIGGVLLIVLGKIVEIIAGLLGPAISFIIQLFTAIIDVVVNVIRFFYDLIAAVIKFVGDAINWIGSFVEDIKSKFQQVGDFISGIWNGIGQAIKDAINWVLDNVVNPFIRKVNDIIRGINNVSGHIGITIGEIGEVPRLQVGVNYVPKDNMLAMLHKGEAVVPASMNPYNPGASTPDSNITGGGGNQSKKEVNITNNFNNYEVDSQTIANRLAFQLSNV